MEDIEKFSPPRKGRRKPSSRLFCQLLLALRCRFLRAFTALFAATLITACATPRAERNAEIPLFDGSTLHGWTQRGGKALYTVEDGCIVGRTVPSEPNSFLCTKKNYRDFELNLDFKIDPELNSGIQVRSQSLPEYQNGRVHGYQVEIDPSERAWTGAIYDEGRRAVMLKDLSDNPEARAAFKPGQWNHLRIICEGDTFSTYLNGVPAATLTDPMTPEGFIGLQVHGVGDRKDPLEVRWRNIRIRVRE